MASAGGRRMQECSLAGHIGSIQTRKKISKSKQAVCYMMWVQLPS